MADTSRPKKVYCLWDDSAPPKLNVGGYDVVRAIRAFGSKIGAVKVLNFYVDLSGSRRLTQRLTSELQCSGVSIINTASSGRQGAASKMLIADLFNHVMDNLTVPTIFLVISADPDLGYAISMLRMRGQELVLVCPSRADANLLRLSEGYTLDGDVLETCSYLAAPITHTPPSPERGIETSAIESDAETETIAVATPQTARVPSGSPTYILNAPAGSRDSTRKSHTPTRPPTKSNSSAGDTNSVNGFTGGIRPLKLLSLWNTGFTVPLSGKQEEEGTPIADEQAGERMPQALPDDVLEGETNVTQPVATLRMGKRIPGSPNAAAYVAPDNASANGMKGIAVSVAVESPILPTAAADEGSISIPDIQPPPSPSMLTPVEQVASLSVATAKAPEAIPPYFQPLIEVLREQSAAGRNAPSVKEVSGQVLARRPHVLDDANVAAKKNPWRKYWSKAQKAGLVVVIKDQGKKTASLSPAYCSSAWSLDAAFDDPQSLDGRCGSHSDSDSTKRGVEGVLVQDLNVKGQIGEPAKEEQSLHGAIATGGLLASTAVAVSAPIPPNLISPPGEEPFTPDSSAKALALVGESDDVDDPNGQHLPLEHNEQGPTSFQALPYNAEEPQAMLHEERRVLGHEILAKEDLQELVLCSAIDSQPSAPHQIPTSGTPQARSPDEHVGDDFTPIESLIKLAQGLHALVPADIAAPSLSASHGVYSQLLEAETSPFSPMPLFNDVTTTAQLSQAEAPAPFQIPSTIPAHFYPLIEFLREKLAAGVHTVLQSELVEPLLARMPQILHHAGVSSKQNPWDEYISAAVKSSIIMALKPPSAETRVSLTEIDDCGLLRSAIPASTSPFPDGHAICQGRSDGSLGEAETAASADPSGNEQATPAAEDEATLQVTLATEGAMALAFTGCVEAVEACPAMKWCVLLKRLPDQQSFPEYYANIQHPISLAEISANIAAGSYQDVEAFEADVKLLFENARAYYRKGSLMATAAQELETVFKLYADEVLDKLQCLTPTVSGFTPSDAPEALTVPLCLPDDNQPDLVSLNATPSPSEALPEEKHLVGRLAVYGPDPNMHGDVLNNFHNLLSHLPHLSPAMVTSVAQVGGDFFAIEWCSSTAAQDFVVAINNRSGTVGTFAYLEDIWVEPPGALQRTDADEGGPPSSVPSVSAPVATLKSLIQLPSSPSPPMVPEIIVDASFTGIGFMSQSRWCSWKLKEGWSSSGRHIQWAELVAIELGLRAAITMGVRSSPLRIRSDNQHAINVLKTHSTRNQHEKIIMDQILGLATANAIQLMPVWISTKLNPADAISRHRYPPAPLRIGTEPPLPPHLTDFVEASFSIAGETCAHLLETGPSPPSSTAVNDEVFAKLPLSPPRDPAYPSLEAPTLPSHLVEDENLTEDDHTSFTASPTPSEALPERDLLQGRLAVYGPDASMHGDTLHNFRALFSRLPSLTPSMIISVASVGGDFFAVELCSNAAARDFVMIVNGSQGTEGAFAYLDDNQSCPVGEVEAVNADAGASSSSASSASAPAATPFTSAPVAAPPISVPNTAVSTSASKPVTTPPAAATAQNPSPSASSSSKVPPVSAPASGPVPSTLTIPPTFLPLVQHFRSLRRQGKITAKRSTLEAPLRQLDPNIFVKFGSARFKKPITSYLASAVDRGILKKEGNNNFALQPKYW